MLRLAVLMSLATAPAWAHAILVDSSPAPNGHVAAGKLDVRFRYNSRIDAARSKLSLTAPNGSTTRLAVHGGATPDLLEAAATVTTGAYLLRWQVLAVDGHITRGSIPFKVDAP